MKIQHLEVFAELLTRKFARLGAASPEDQLKPEVADLFASAGLEYGLTVETRTESHVPEHKVRPDIAIYVDGLICGYVELKAPGLGADAPKLSGDHNKKQWQKLKGLPNLIYTDGRDWALYRFGNRPNGQPIVRLQDDPTEKGSAATTQEDAEALERLFRDFLGWQPAVPHSPRLLAEYLAPLTRFMRSEVNNALATPKSAATLLSMEWREYLFPDADDAQFADAYAQTVTYAMLLARLSGASKLDPVEAAGTLDKNNGLLAKTLELFGQEKAREELRVSFGLLQRSLEALDPYDFLDSRPDLWLYFYEDFLAAYDPKLRRDFGVYYTPREVVELQVRLGSELLETRFGKRLGFADDGVLFLDPAVGTGTYPVAAVKHGLEKVRVRSGDGAVPERARQMAENMYGFEILVGPYAVAHLRLRQVLEGAINEGTIKGQVDEGRGLSLNIYLADTLASPNKSPRGVLPLIYQPLTREREAAHLVKNEGDILVCLGNPPYNRQTIDEGDTTTQRRGGWVRFGDQVEGGARQEEQKEFAIFDDFTEPARKTGAGVHLKNLYNDYVYFWRWALWRLFEQQSCGGIVTFITASSFLGGPGFVGMREYMRREFDEIYVINLGGDQLGTRKTPNVFSIKTPVAITTGVRLKNKIESQPATVRYVRVEAEDRQAKLNNLEAISALSDVNWEVVADGWMDPFYPRSQATYFSWPELSDLFPWQHSGLQFKRIWPIAESRKLLETRWQKFCESQPERRRELFKETDDRRIARQYDDFKGVASAPVADLRAGDPLPVIDRYSYRAFDRRYAIIDNRFGDRLRPPLVNARGANNIFFTSLITRVLGAGSAVVVAADLPDLHHFRGSFGGKDVIPLYRDAAGAEPNITGGLLTALGKEYGTTPSVEDFAAYIYAVLGNRSYTKRFWDELETPGPRVPLTKDGDVFATAVKNGRTLIWLHTYAERFLGENHKHEVPQGSARIVVGVPSDQTSYPDTYRYDAEKSEIMVGGGRFGPVAPEVWEFEVSGLKVVQSWLGYRMKNRAGRRSSPLDDIRPEHWTPRMSDELLELLWVLEATLAMEPDLEKILDNIVASPCFTAEELPKPMMADRRAPGKETVDGGLLQMTDV